MPTPNALALSTHAARPAWKTALANAVSDVNELCALLELPAETRVEIERACADFPLRVPRGFVDRMRKRDPNDPLLRQVMPSALELHTIDDYELDPLDESDAAALPGLLHKYKSRALITLTGSCAVHCRYCFRRHFDYADHRIDSTQWHAIVDYLTRNSDINEVILSGGDPLNATDTSLARAVERLESVEHITRLRLHTRQPVVLPERIDQPLIDWLAATRFHTVIVIHANHANELDDTVARALGALRDAGATLLNQSVLLAGVNDAADALYDLSERLFACGVLPYYLHLPDKVQGTAHFDVPELRARELALRTAHQELCAQRQWPEMHAPPLRTPTWRTRGRPR
ncbi:MAG: EF-P beta-lysylation protein EpmB [Pseudomonadota bacterium]